jgi:hypothetical protein
MTPGANESVKSPPLENVAGESHVKNSYVDCATNVDGPRQRRPLPPPSGPALKGESGTSQHR